MNLTAQEIITANNLLEKAKSADELEKELVTANLTSINPPFPEDVYIYYRSINNILSKEKVTLVNELCSKYNK